MTTHKDDQFDKALDAALKNYIEEPRAGLELRVMNRVRAEALAPTAGAWFASWARWTVAAVACGILVIAVYFARHASVPPGVGSPNVAQRPAPVIKQNVPRVRETPLAPTTVANTTRPRQHVATAARQVEPLPRLEQFPARTPLTEDEIALMAWARRASPASQAALASALKDKIKPIEIGEIKIPPLEGGDQ